MSDATLAYRDDVIHQTILSSYEDAVVRVRLLVEAVERNIGPGE